MHVQDDSLFLDLLLGLKNGDFSRLNPMFERRGQVPPPIIQWIEDGRFHGHDQELAEALTCACFNGQTEVAENLLAVGIPPSGGINTGLNAIHWAANRGQLQAVRLLIRHNVPLETRSMYDATVLGTAVYAAIYEPRTPDHQAIIEELLCAGARVEESGFPTGNEAIDSILQRHSAT